LNHNSILGDNLFGDGNLGDAFNQFPVQHVCNDFYRWFELGKPTKKLQAENPIADERINE